MKKLIILSLTFAAIASLGTAAEEKKDKPKGKGDPAKLFAKLDTNSDGKLSKEEFLASPMATKMKESGKGDPEKVFTARDKDNSGDLNLEEFVARPPGKGKKAEADIKAEAGKKAEEGKKAEADKKAEEGKNPEADKKAE